MPEKKIELIHVHCQPVFGQVIEKFETAEILLGDGQWDEWADLPIRIYFQGGSLLSVAWSQFEELWLANDESLPFPVETGLTRWKTNIHPELNSAIGKTIRGVSLGGGNMTCDSKEVEIWTRLLFDLGDSWLEVYNGLDENAYSWHDKKPEGEFRSCI